MVAGARGICCYMSVELGDAGGKQGYRVLRRRRLERGTLGRWPKIYGD